MPSIKYDTLGKMASIPWRRHWTRCAVLFMRSSSDDDSIFFPTPVFKMSLTHCNRTIKGHGDAGQPIGNPFLALGAGVFRFPNYSCHGKSPPGVNAIRKSLRNSLRLYVVCPAGAADMFWCAPRALRGRGGPSRATGARLLHYPQNHTKEENPRHRRTDGPDSSSMVL